MNTLGGHSRHICPRNTTASHREVWHLLRRPIRLLTQLAILIIALAPHSSQSLSSEERGELARKFKYYHRSVQPALELNLLDSLNGTFFRLVAELELAGTRPQALSNAAPNQLEVEMSLVVHYRDDRLLLRDLPGVLALPEEFQPWTPRIQPLPMEAARALGTQKMATLEPKTGHLTLFLRFHGPLVCDFDAWKVPFERYTCTLWFDTDQDDRLSLRTVRDLRPDHQMARISLHIEHWPFLTLRFVFGSQRWQHALVGVYLPSLLLFSCALLAQWKRRKVQVLVSLGALLATLLLIQRNCASASASPASLLDLWLGAVFVHLCCLLSADLLLPARRVLVFRRTTAPDLGGGPEYALPTIGTRQTENGGKALAEQQSSSPSPAPLYSSLHYVSSPQLRVAAPPPRPPPPIPRSKLPPQPIAQASGQTMRARSVPPRRLDQVRITMGGSEPLARKTPAQGAQERERAIAALLAEMEQIRRVEGAFRHADSEAESSELLAVAEEGEVPLHRSTPTMAPISVVEQFNTWGLRRPRRNLAERVPLPEMTGSNLLEGIPRRKRIVLSAISLCFSLFFVAYSALVLMAISSSSDFSSTN